MDLRRMRRGDVYPGAGDSTIVRTTPSGMETFHPDDRLYEGNMALPVTPSIGGGLKVGQFTLAQATVGLLAMLGFIYWMDRRVL